MARPGAVLLGLAVAMIAACGSSANHPGTQPAGGGGATDAASGAAGGSASGGSGATAGAGGSSDAGGGTGGSGGAAPTGLMVLTDDGGWSWFESPRAFWRGGTLIVGSVASGWNDPSRRGDVEALVYDSALGTTTVVELHDRLELDDHDSAVFLPRPDGRLVALYAKHGTENHFYYRLTQAGDPRVWLPEQTFIPSASTALTYSNLFLLSAESNRVYDFYRGLDGSYKPSYAYSSDLGATWTSGNVVIGFPSTQLQRPYVRYASNGTDTIHLLYTDAHPRDFNNSLYHIYYRGGMLHRSDGTAIGPLTQGLAAPTDGTRIFQGDPAHVAWSVDIVTGPAQALVAVYSVQMDSAGLAVGMGGTDIRYRYARFDGAAWQDHALGYAGSRLYSGEDDYSGLVAVDPAHPSIVYLSANADPATGAPLISAADGLRHYEVWRGETTDGGTSWLFTPVTSNSTKDNLRPILPPGGPDGLRALVWLRGTYRAYTDYQQDVVTLVWHE